MKKQYVSPKLQVELFALSENIASCATRVLFGPNDPASICEDWGFVDPLSINSKKRRTSGMIYPFYDDNTCQCYYSAPRQSGYFSS